MPPTQKMRIILKAFDHRVLDVSAQQILETAERTGARGRRSCSYAYNKKNVYSH